MFANTGGVVTLSRPGGTPDDVLVYKGGIVPAEGGWRGGSVWPYVPSSVFHEQGQILYRKFDEQTGWPLTDTDSAADWASDPLDVLDGRRVRYAGWPVEQFLLPLVVDEPANLQVFVAPDHAFEALSAHLAAATQSVVFEGFTFESAPLAALIAAPRPGRACQLRCCWKARRRGASQTSSVGWSSS